MVKPLLSTVSKRIDKIGYVTDIEGDRKFWWKYVKMSKILDIVPDNDEKQQEKFKVILKPHCHFVFGGDINDQYDGDIEVVEEVLKLKRQYPDRVHFILGNRDINKLRMTQELSKKHVKEYQWNETYPGTFWTQIFFKGLSPYEQIRSKGVKFIDSTNNLIDRLRWILSCTMGSPNAFMNRFHELSRRENANEDNNNNNIISYDMVVDNFITNIKPNGIFAEYMKHAKLALVIKDTLFVHGAICTNSYGWIPGESNNKNNDNDGHTDDIDYNNKRIKDTDVNEWVNKLNAFASKGIYDCIHSDQDATPWSFTGGYKNHNTPCSNILQYGMGWLPNGKRNRTIVYNQWVIEDKNKLNSINFPTEEIINNLHLHGVKRILTGHKPLGDSPAIFSNNDRNFHVITADTSYSARTKYLNGMNEETLKIFDEFKKCDEQHAEHMNKSSDNIPKDISDIRHHGRRGYAVSEVIIDFDNNKKDSNNNDGVVFIHGTLANGDLFEANLNMEPLIGQQTNDGKFIQGIRLKDQKFIVSHSKGWNVFNEFFKREEVEKML